MALMTALRKIKDAREAYHAALEENGGEAGANKLAAHLGAFVPAGYVLRWTQGTPSFNDGEPCTFSVGDAHLAPMPTARSDGEDSDVEDANEPEEAPNLEDAEFDIDWEEVGALVELHGRGGKASNPLEGVPTDAWIALCKAWKEISAEEDLLENAFAGDAEVFVISTGEHRRDDHELY